jgi:hypothetical protein
MPARYTEARLPYRRAMGHGDDVPAVRAHRGKLTGSRIVRCTTAAGSFLGLGTEHTRALMRQN